MSPSNNRATTAGRPEKSGYSAAMALHEAWKRATGGKLSAYSKPEHQEVASAWVFLLLQTVDTGAGPEQVSPFLDDPFAPLVRCKPDSYELLDDEEAVTRTFARAEVDALAVHLSEHLLSIESQR